MMRCVPLALAASACSTPPNGFCTGDNAIDPGPGCSVPLAAITIDGDVHDWDAVPSVACRGCVDGAAGDVTHIRSTRTADHKIAFWFDTQGAPLTDASHSYLSAIGPLREPSYWIDVRLRPTAPPELALNNIALTGLPVEYAFGTAGVEVAFPVAALPHNGGIHVFADLELLDSGNNTWSQRQVASPETTACWDPTSPVCQPL